MKLENQNFQPLSYIYNSINLGKILNMVAHNNINNVYESLYVIRT